MSMSTDRPEFRPIETAPVRRHWPYAVLGAIIAGLLLFIARRDVSAKVTPEKQVALASVAPKIEPLIQAEAAKTAAPQTASQQAAPPAAKAPEGPNVIGNAINAAGKLATVARVELDRELGRTKAAQKQADAYRKQIESLQKELSETRAQVAAMQKARTPPPPSDQEQILQMLAPVLRSSNDGRP
jgi:hypothetical protein